ncbi:hypothetical protein F4803DRAFT_554699 [Xylaria telfairii]|nr:hypothetical protein F4803DRAFT_554699 [Xylaria telfairii]
MPPAQQPGTNAAHKAAMLRGLLQQPSKKHSVAPLVAAIMARAVDIHERMLTDLRSRVQQLEGNLSTESEHTARLLEQMRNIGKDAKILQELIQADRQRDIGAGPDPDQLKLDLTGALNQYSAEMTGFRRRIQIIQEAVEGQQHTTDQVKETLDSFGQPIKSLQRDIGELKGSLEKVPFTAPIVEWIEKLEEKIMKLNEKQEERMAKLEEKILKCFDQSSMDAEIIKLYLAGPREEIEHVTDQPTDDTNTLDDRLTGQSQATSKQGSLEDWPAIVDFVTIYSNFLESYKSKRPEDDMNFIETFLGELNKVNVHISCALQRHLLETCPKKVALITSEVGQQHPDIFIKPVRMKWNDMKRAMEKLRDLKTFQWASNDGISGPSPTPITK